ncbi:hypothetical protein PVAND_015866 [Polypedilum vanderplanki]|uniref:Uncharacterized protein n=1 Tax=Polypedilum vanderplanki TaxID=319348 RepID=A0A9J6BDT3_POLVA|nr:hypothetical protein PVAND_015866 [Polypedilum vanderplanki]
MKSLIFLAIIGFVTAQIQVQVHPQNRPPVQIQGPTVILPPREPNFDEQPWHQPIEMPDWIRNNPMWQNEMPQPQPQPDWNQRPVRPDRPTRPAPEGHNWDQSWQPQPQPLPEWNFWPQPEWNVRPEPMPMPEWNNQWIQRPAPQPIQPPQPEWIQPPQRLPIRPQPQPPQWQQPRADWRQGEIHPDCPVTDDTRPDAVPVFLDGLTDNTFFICWGRVAWPFTCPGNSVWRDDVTPGPACAHPGWEPQNNRWNNNWQPIRPFVDQEMPEPY